MIKFDFKKIKEVPGVYLFKDKENKVLYIGKAKNLRKRLKQYLKTSSEKIKKLLQEVVYFEIVETKNEIEAILKESDLIKKFEPPYNQLLKDDTKYFYLVFTQDVFPKLIITHQPEKFSVLKIVGPFVEGTSLKTILNLLRKEIPFCTCFKSHKRICLNANLGLCYGFCCLKDSDFKKEEKKIYFENLKLIKGIFTKKITSLKKEIFLKMKQLLAYNKIEEANFLKKVYLALKKIELSQDLIKDNDSFLIENKLRKILFILKKIFYLSKLPHRIEVIDISHFAGKEKVGIIVTFLDGIHRPQFLRKFKIKKNITADDPRMIYEVLKRRLKHQEWGLPDLILVDGGKSQFKFAQKALADLDLKIDLLALAKPKKEVYFSLTKKPIFLEKFPEIKNFILSLDRKAHQNVVKYHRSQREAIVK